jgi:hypothetical protein
VRMMALRTDRRRVIVNVATVSSETSCNGARRSAGGEAPCARRARRSSCWGSGPRRRAASRASASEPVSARCRRPRSRNRAIV